METSVQTSELLKQRVKLVEEERLEQMESNIRGKDFDKVGKLAIRESNSLHAVCLDTYPPLFYLNDKSKEIIRLVSEFNDFEKTSPDSLKAFYSFDAGPNAWLFVLDEHRSELLYLIYKFYFSETMEESEFIVMLRKSGGLDFYIDEIKEDRRNKLDAHFGSLKHGSGTKLIKYIISSKVGQDPKPIRNDWSKSLLNIDGLPC